MNGYALICALVCSAFVLAAGDESLHKCSRWRKHVDKCMKKAEVSDAAKWYNGNSTAIMSHCVEESKDKECTGMRDRIKWCSGEVEKNANVIQAKKTLDKSVDLCYKSIPNVPDNRPIPQQASKDTAEKVKQIAQDDACALTEEEGKCVYQYFQSERIQNLQKLSGTEFADCQEQFPKGCRAQNAPLRICLCKAARAYNSVATPVIGKCMGPGYEVAQVAGECV